MVMDKDLPKHYRIVDPRNGEVVATGVRDGSQTLDIGAAARMEIIPDPGGAPRLYIFWNET
jgi:hypothetical protein